MLECGQPRLEKFRFADAVECLILVPEPDG